MRFDISGAYAEFASNGRLPGGKTAAEYGGLPAIVMQKEQFGPLALMVARGARIIQRSPATLAYAIFPRTTPGNWRVSRGERARLTGAADRPGITSLADEEIDVGALRALNRRTGYPPGWLALINSAPHPGNFTLLPLPPYSPEFNPVECLVAVPERAFPLASPLRQLRGHRRGGTLDLADVMSLRHGLSQHT
jgi:hypothetical protein